MCQATQNSRTLACCIKLYIITETYV